MLAAFISALSSAATLIIDKMALSRERIALHVFLPITFVFLFAFTGVLVPLLGKIDWQIALLPNSVFLLFLMVVIAVTWNVLYYQTLQKTKAHEHQVIEMFGPLFTVILAAVFFPEEFQGTIFVLALVASTALIFARLEKAHLRFDPVSYNLFLAVILMATETIIIRELLYSYTPVALYGIRTFIIAIFFMAYYRPRYRQVSSRHWWWIAAGALGGVTLMLSRFYAFGAIGVIHATLISALAPVIVFVASWEILHERIRFRVVLAALIILLCVSWATILSFS